MADLNITNLNKKSDKYLFKNKLPLKRKSIKRLLRESFLMLFLSILLVFVNYLIPNKNLLLQNLLLNLNKSYLLSLELFSYVFQILLVIYVLFSGIIALILLMGAIYRVLKIIRRKSKRMAYK